METISHWILSFVVNSAWQGIIIVVGAFGCALALRRAPARYQHLLWVAALLLIVTVPFLTIERQPAGTRGEIVPASESHVAKNHSLSVGAGALSAGVSNQQTSNRGGFPTGSYRGDIIREVTIEASRLLSRIISSFISQPTGRLW